MASSASLASDLTDTIVAVASPPGEGARAIVRLSGPDSFSILASLCRCPEGAEANRPAPYTVLSAEVDLPGWGVSLPALVYLMPAPRSYTREDVAELHFVGSPPVVLAVLEACLEQGARLARAGEFTRRALLAGRIDLAQAEALLKLIDAPDEDAARTAVRELAGSLGDRLTRVADLLFDLVTRVEAAIDFSQDDIELIDDDEVGRVLGEARAEVQALLPQAREGVIEALPMVLIFGRPNAGKSSLFNRLTGRSAALVTPVAGTTRDAVEAVLSLGDFRLRLLDGAGQWEDSPASALDARAAERTRELLARADLVLHLIDAQQPLTDRDRQLAALVASRPHVWVRSKSDLCARVAPESLAELTGAEAVLCTSSETGQGIDDLREAVRSAFLTGGAQANSPGFLLNARQREGLRKAAHALSAAQSSLNQGLGEEFVAVDLWEALDRLGALTGRRTSDDVLDGVFSRFCIGK